MSALMQLADAYRQLDLDPGASEETLRGAWLDLTKVWHPDRFAHDPGLRAKAQEKLKSINEAYETILSSRASGFAPESSSLDPGPPPRPMLPRYTAFAIVCAAMGLLVLLRRPTPGGLILAATLFVFAAFTLARIRRMRKRS